MTLTVATPLAGGTLSDGVDVAPDALGFRHVAIPGYDSARSFLGVRRSLASALGTLVEASDVVQLDGGGHPIPLGLAAAPVAADAGRPTLWVIGGVVGAGGSSRNRLWRSAGTAAKRIVGRGVDRRVDRRFAEALRAAAAVVATCPAAADRVRDASGMDAAIIESIDVRDDEVAGPGEASARHARLVDAARALRLAVVGGQTIDRGTCHVLAAIHRCWRLRVPVELAYDPRGGEGDAIAARAAELGLSSAVVATTDDRLLGSADVLVDASCAEADRADIDLAVARGQAPIAYGPPGRSSHATWVAAGDVDALAAAVFAAAIDRASLAARMLRGVAWARARTLEAAYRRRFASAFNFAAAAVLP